MTTTRTLRVLPVGVQNLWRRAAKRGVGDGSGGARGRAVERLTVVPGHPVLRIHGHLAGVTFQLGEVIERIRSVQFTGVDADDIARHEPVLLQTQDFVLTLLAAGGASATGYSRLGIGGIDYGRCTKKKKEQIGAVSLSGSEPSGLARMAGNKQIPGQEYVF